MLQRVYSVSIGSILIWHLLGTTDGTYLAPAGEPLSTVAVRL
jgi:hypothetical protein